MAGVWKYDRDAAVKAAREVLYEDGGDRYEGEEPSESVLAAIGAEICRERSAHEETRRRVEELELMYADMKDCADRGSKSVFALPAAQARIAELEAALDEAFTYIAHGSIVGKPEPGQGPVEMLLARLRPALSASSPKDALREVCEKVAQAAWDRACVKHTPQGTNMVRCEEVPAIVSSILGPEVKP